MLGARLFLPEQSLWPTRAGAPVYGSPRCLQNLTVVHGEEGGRVAAGCCCLRRATVRRISALRVRVGGLSRTCRCRSQS